MKFIDSLIIITLLLIVIISFIPPEIRTEITTTLFNLPQATPVITTPSDEADGPEVSSKTPSPEPEVADNPTSELIPSPTPSPIAVVPKNFSNSQAAANTLKTLVQNSDKFVVAYSYEAGPFSYNGEDKDTPNFDGGGNQAFGIEVEMVEAFVKEILGRSPDEEANDIIEWRPISAKDRVNKAKESNIDLVIGAISSNSGRCDYTSGTICTASSHWIDTQALLVSSGDNDTVEFEDICSENDDGLEVSVVDGTTADVFKGRMSECANRVLRTDISRSTALDKVISGRRIAYKSDAEILKFYEKYYDPGELQIVGEGEIDAEENYVFLTKTGNEGLAALLSKAIREMIDNCQLKEWVKNYNATESKITRECNNS